MSNDVASTVCFFKELHKTLSAISDADAGALMKALFAHANDEEPNSLSSSPVAAALYVGAVDQMDRLAHYRQRRSDNRKRYEAIRNDTNGNKAIRNDTERYEQERTEPDAIRTGYPYPISNSNNKREREKKEKVDLPDTGIWADAEVREAFKEYAKMRVRIKKSLTPEAVKRKIPQLERLADTAQEAVEIIHTATDNCWLDFYAPRDNKPQKANQKQAFNFTERKTDYEALLDSMGV